MNISTEKFVKIADDAVKKYEEKLLEVYVFIFEEMIKNMFENNIPKRNYTNEEKTAWQDSWKWILLSNRASDRIKAVWDLDMCFFKNTDDIEKKYE